MNIDNPCACDIPALKKLWKEAFCDADNDIDVFFKTAFGEKRSMCVKSGDDLAAALYWFDCSYLNRTVAYIYAVATFKAYRGEGVCHKLMEHTHNHLRSLGYDGAVLVPGGDSLFEFYSKMGYSVCSCIKEISCIASKNIINIRRIYKNEYAKLRRTFIPVGGVVQEKENLDYLDAQANFYAGDNFLMVSRMDGEKLYGIELLGDSSVASDILCTLNCKEGNFRIPGDEKAFAMYFPLHYNDTIVPEYFGLAFD